MDNINYDFYTMGDKTSTDFYWQVKLSTKSIRSKRDGKNPEYQKAKDNFQNQIFKYKRFVEDQTKLLRALDLYIPHPDPANIPKYSLFIQFKFFLKKPFYSHDDEDFYIVENAVLKEHIFKVPMIRPSSWKGNLKNTFIKLNDLTTNYKEDEQIQRLFGSIDKDDNLQKKGRLIFYPTYFDNVGVEIINPHDRNTKTGNNPILYEIVPPGSSGFFSLLYAPFDLIGKNNQNLKQIQDDYSAILEAIEKMMTTCGFGGKTSSGYGVVEDKIKNCIINTSISAVSEFKDLKKIIAGEL